MRLGLDRCEWVAVRDTEEVGLRDVVTGTEAVGDSEALRLRERLQDPLQEGTRL